MNDLLSLLPALISGVVLGAFFFGGLWWTVRKLITAKHVALLFLGSMLLRTAIVVLGFYFMLGDDWHKLVAGLLGFVIARIIVTRLTRVASPDNSVAKKDCHAS
jgi:F1F0 ATPase subunit 2